MKTTTFSKWKASDYKAPFIKWTPPKLLYPSTPSEKESLHALKKLFGPLEPYKELETKAESQNTLVSLDTPLPDGHIAFLENTAERCTSPTTKHSAEGMQGARHWVQRVDTPDGLFQRLTDGYGVSLMFGERCHQYIRNSHNWRGINGVQLDLDVWYQQPDALKKKLEAEDRDADFIAERLDANEKLPLPVYSQSELFDRYPLLPRICSYLTPSASSLYEGRPFKARGVVLFPEPVTDMRVYRQFGDILCGELDCIPPNVTKNPVAVGFGNTHNAPQAYRNDNIDTAWIHDRLQECAVNVITETRHRVREKQQKAERKAHYASRSKNGTSNGENISAFIEKCDPVAEMVKDGLLTPGKGNDYRWHQSENARSCDILDGVIHIFSHTMSAASPAAALEPVGAHRFYLYQLCRLDMTLDADKPKIREFLFERGYGSDPKAFTSKRNRKPVRLQNKTDLQYVLEPLHKSREKLAEAFAKGANLIGVRADTVVGKTYQAEMYYLKGYDGFFSTPTGDLAKEVSGRFEKKGIIVFLWRGVASNPDGDFPHEKPCMFPDEYIALAEKGRNAYNVLCENCPFRAECDEHGYRSQEEKAKKASVIVAAHKDLLLNPTFRTTAKRLLPHHPDDLIAIDEFDILESFIDVNIPQLRLEYLRDTWYDHPLGKFAKQLLDACVVQNAPFTGISHVIEILSNHEREEIITALGELRMGDTILDADVAEDYERKKGQASGLENIKKLPVLETQADWNMLTKLELFFDVYKHAGTAPMEWKDNTLTFHVPPLPYYTRARVILMSATLNERFFRPVFKIREEKRGDVDFLDLKNTEWHPDVRVYQLRTNRNPRRTLLQGEQDDETGRWHYTSKLTQTGQTYLDKIKDSIAKSDKKSGFIGHKAIIDNHTDDIDAATGHFGGLVGLNEHFFRDEDDGILLHILGTPNIGQEALETSCKLLLGMTESPLDFTRNKDGTYSDPNVQAVADAIIQSELTQAGGRAGLAKNPSDVVIWSSYELPSISHREQTILFDENDWEAADGNLNNLAQIVAEREAHEKAVADAVKKGDTKTVAKLMGVSERHARRITQEPRQKNTANENDERDAKVIKLHEHGLSLRKIHTEIGETLGISYGTVANIVRAYKNGHGHVYIPHADVRSCTPPTNTDVPCVESETLHKSEVEPDHDTFFKLLDISACFYGKHQLSPSEVSQFTGIDESEVCEILDEWYETVVISPGIGEKYWMSESDEKKLWDKILGPTLTEWGQNFPGQKILCPPVAFNPHLNPKNTF